MSSINIFVVVLMVLIFIGIPMSACFGLAAYVYLLLENVPLLIVAQTLINRVDSITLTAVPLFILSGNLMSAGGIARRLIRLASLMVGDVPGGLAYITIACCAFFASLTGSAMATAVAIGSIMLPYMLQAGYNKEYACSVIAAGAILGPIIPPSTGLIIFGNTASCSIISLYKVGVPAGLFLALLMCILAYFMCKKRGYGGLSKTHVLKTLKGFENIKEDDKLSLRQIVYIVVEAFPALISPFFILGSLFSGIATPSEAAAVSVLVSFVVGVFIYKEIKPKDFIRVIRATAKQTATTLFIVANAGLFAWVLSFSRMPDVVMAGFQPLVEAMGSMGVMFVIAGIMLILGCFMNPSSIMILTIPLFLDLTKTLGFSVFHYGIITQVAVGVGFITPPFGNVLFCMVATFGIKLHTLAKALIPALLLLIFALALIVMFPQITQFVL